MLRSWLRIARIHTANLSQAAVIIGLLLAGEYNTTLIILFALWATVYHGSGFMQNNLMDYQYDLKDSAKQHFPLVTGEISMSIAFFVTYSLMALCFIVGLFLSNGRPLSILFLISAFFFGTLYNMQSKKSLLSPLYISVAFTSLLLFAYFSVAGGMSVLMLLVALYAFFMLMFQISVEGYTKDLETDPVNLLRWLGCDCGLGKIRITGRAKVYAWMMRVPTYLLAFGIWYYSKSDIFSLALICLLIPMTSKTVWKLLESGDYDNKKTVRYCAVIEILTYWILVLALQGAIGWIWTIVLVVYPILWFLMLNQITWKTWVRPAV